jgi:uncharacterized protein YndB with AHSA1/START domain
MAVRNVLIEAQPPEVWEVLADGQSYAEWVVGTQSVDSVDPDWPAVGANLRYKAGVGPIHLVDVTTVRVSEPPHRLEMEAHMRLLTVRISVEVRSWGEQALVIVDEHPLRGSSLLFENPVSEALLTIRNRLMLSRLALVVSRRH